jgi:hypothetical protein
LGILNQTPPTYHQLIEQGAINAGRILATGTCKWVTTIKHIHPAGSLNAGCQPEFMIDTEQLDFPNFP